MPFKMKYLFCQLFCFSSLIISAQHLNTSTNSYTIDQEIQVTYLGESDDLVNHNDYDAAPNAPAHRIKVIPNFNGRGTGPVSHNPNGGPDELLTNKQYGYRSTSNRTASTSLTQNWAGMGFNGVQPPDPCLEVGPNHVIQMINAPGGATMEVWDKAGVSLYGPANLNNLWNQFGVTGLGDPIVCYDQLADRWLISEFSSVGNKLLIGISTSPDPMGTYHAYEFNTPTFPDYPKYSIWHNAYFVTTNESQTAIYALDRSAMLNGLNTTAQRFTVPDLSSFGFQALTPVDFDGTTLPASNSPGLFWRHVDDEAHFPSSSNPTSDFLQYWELTPDFNNSANSVLQGPLTINVTEFDSDINGYFAFSGITQPNSSISLDPLREVFMNRMQYRNFGTHEVIVGCHATDVTGNDLAGIRWYEFRRNGIGPWSLYQEGTYSPDSDNRWMATISMDENGNIALAYAVSSNTTFPSLRYTGRVDTDPAGAMPLQEQSIVSGNGSNTSNRYGDYFAMVVDPADDSTFWFTGEYNPSSTWDTRVAGFTIDDQCNGLNASYNQTATILCNGDATAALQFSVNGGNSSNYTFVLSSQGSQNDSLFTNLSAGNYSVTITDGTGCSFTIPSIAIGEPPALQSNASTVDVSCFGEADGQINITGTGGSGGLTYSIDNNSFVSSGSFNNLDTGAYTYYVQDVNGCTSSNTFTISQPDSLSATASQNGTAINVTVTGGTPGYMYKIDDEQFGSTNTFNNLAAGMHTIVVRDANGCAYSISIEYIALAIEEELADIQVRLFPNPVSSELNISFTTQEYGLVQISILDANGRVITQDHVQLSDVSQWTQSTSKWASGSYFVQLEIGEESTAIPFVVQ